MSILLVLLVLAGPAALAAASLLSPRPQQGSALPPAQRWVERATWLGLAAAFLAPGVLAWSGIPIHASLAVQGLGVGVYYDALTAVMLALVAFVGVVVVRYGRNYLAGDPGHDRFVRWLGLALAAVLLLIVSGNLLHFVLAWIATSLCLHELLTFYSNRPRAQLAARKKFVISRVGDAALILAAILLHRTFGTLEFAALFEAAESMRASGSVPPSVQLVAGLLVLGAVLKSAQFPFHTWLLEVMETPTPVSALLHAGIINAGGFLVVRLSDLIVLFGPALDALALIGGVTALVGSVVMLTQTSIKVSLACSTVAQMGFMMLQCGLGAFSAAVLHIVAHSLYKAHAFLSSGSVVDLARAAAGAKPTGRPHGLLTSLAVVGSILAAWGFGELIGVSALEEPGIVALGAILLMGIVHLTVNATIVSFDVRVIRRVALTGAGLAVLYFGLQRGALTLLHDAVATRDAAHSAFQYAVAVLVVASFGAITVLQNLLPYRAMSDRWAALYTWISGGLYVNSFWDRLILRIWPPSAVRIREESHS
jgi:NAD(P)H-quinone oxidoreductase subunit 5